MHSYSARVFLLIFVLSMASGCNSALLNHQVFDGFRPNPNGYQDAADDPGSEWDFVGDEGRGDQSRVVEADDQWFKKHLMSARARSIERNLGFD